MTIIPGDTAPPTLSKFEGASILSLSDGDLAELLRTSHLPDRVQRALKDEVLRRLSRKAQKVRRRVRRAAPADFAAW